MGHIPGHSRNLHPISDSNAPPSNQHKITESGKDDALKRNRNTRRQQPKESGPRGPVGRKRKRRNQGNGEPKENSLAHPDNMAALSVADIGGQCCAQSRR